MKIEGTIAENKFGRYLVPKGVEDRPASRAALKGRVYELETLEFMQEHAGDGDIIHAGAFFGDFLPALSAALAPQAHLWAFEPNPGSYDAARETIALNGLENVTLTNAAVSDGQETLHFRTHRRNGAPMGGKSKVVDKPGPGVVPVEAVLLDYAVPLERKVSILQLDVEDHEDKALRGAYHIIHKWKPILILEYFGEAGWIRRNFRSLGYEKVGKVHGNYVYAVADVARQLSIPDASDGAAAK